MVSHLIKAKPTGDTPVDVGGLKTLISTVHVLFNQFIEHHFSGLIKFNSEVNTGSLV